MSYIARRRAQGGFTIPELIIVIIVILVLLGLVLATRAGVAAKERNTERQRDIAELRSNIEAYYAQHDAYPTLSQMNKSDWREANLKGMDPEVLRDPLLDGDYTLRDKPSDKGYSYQVSAADGNSCDDKKVMCTQYTLSAELEGGGRYTKNNLN